MDEIHLLQKKLARERAARKQAEKILETKALELFKANESLKELNQSLELEIAKRTASLQESELRYRMLVEQAQDIIYKVDQDGYFTYVNSIAINRFGYTEQNLLGKRFVDFIPEEDVEKEFNYYANFRANNTETDYHEFRLKSISGDIFWLGQNVTRVSHEDGSFYYTVVARDITQRKKTEKALEIAKSNLEKSEVKYRSIIENMDLGLMEVDTNGRILRVYDKFNKMLGYEEGELVGRSANDTLLVNGFEKVLEEQDANRVKGMTGVYEVKIKRKDGNEIWVLISGAPFYNEKGEVIGSIGVHYDITDRKALEEELEIARLNAVKAQQAEKSFLANMSHEIRTPLNAIIGMSHLLKDTVLNDEQIDYLNALTSSADILKSLISDILDISKIDAGTLDVQARAFNVHDLVNQLVQAFSLQSQNKEVAFNGMIDPKIDYMVYGDPQLLNQVLLNLLSNAQKFTEKGSVFVEVAITDESSDFVKLHFKVSDTGIGISEIEKSIIFNEFKQANAEIRRKYGGTGLGLSISNLLIQLMGGSLVVDSSLGVGSTFSFILQFKKSHKKLSSLANAPIKKLPVQGNKILVVEDNEMNLKYITSLLKKWELDYTTCHNGREACELVEKTKFDLIFMDLQMPEMDGFEATQTIRRMDNDNKNTPIVALTASTFLSKKRLALKAGMSEFLSKPFTPKQLFEMTSKFLARQHQKPQVNTDYEFSPLLDLQFIQEAYGADMEYAKEMFETFLEIIDNELLLIKSSFQEGNQSGTLQQLHKIKPTFMMVGLREITDRIEEIENTLKQQKSMNPSLWYQDLEDNVRYYIPILEEEVKKLNQWLKY